ncbi:shikimate dehydrogenase [Faecalicatena sp. AGMB00832]|uniref:Shikimate dehydrogenase (NADP(+)) n=1 Tax=Faecalicatena faecalis TaxID=2726362 RepID=A0ABS6D4P3_9FIRM|nr:shikimate dehydrogenase [Faecalicatena faecalis]MBU3876192.1 shikimate dehydrogenase [Faecalicatena faecalis]
MNIETTDVIHLGVLGETLGHSLSPEIHEDLLEQQNIKGTYEKYEMNDQEVLHILDVMKRDQVIGMNVTIPYKEVVYRLVDELDEHAKKIGAVNTILIENGISYGYNTDYIGIISMFKKADVSLAGKDIVILGSGGAAKALIYGFHLEGAARITVAARNEKAIDSLKELFPYIHTCTLNRIPGGDILVNTTPVGMYPNAGESPVDTSVIRQFKVAADIVYNPLITEFLKIARDEGLKIVTGLMMLVDQAIGSEEIWLHKKLDYNMGNHIHDELAKQF